MTKTITELMQQRILNNLRGGIVWLPDEIPGLPLTRWQMLRHKIRRGIYWKVVEARHAIANRICRHEDW